LIEASREVEVLNENGVHVRPSSRIVEVANNYTCRLALMHGEVTADARSVIELLQLQAVQGNKIKIRAKGEDAEAAVEALVALFADRFGFES